jgi:hypothetical protein
MTLTKELMTETAKSAAAYMAEKLDMQQVELMDCWADRPILIATHEGISMGTLKVDQGEMRTYRYANFTLNGELLFTDKFAITEKGWEEKPATEVFLDNAAVIYAGYGTVEP